MDERIAAELGVARRQVSAAVELLDGGATVPFIARYRKEATGTLDDAQLRTLEERLRLLLREIFTAAGGTHDDFDAYDRVMAEERRVAVLVTPERSFARA